MDSNDSPTSSSVAFNDDNEVESIIDEEQDDRVELLPHEQELLLETMNDDVLFVTGRGLGLEQLMLHHLHLYSDSKLLVLVINATSADEHFFLHKLKQINPGCPPKLINSSVTNKQREQVYLDGGVQFITSRVLMTDLLTKLIPSKNVTGIIVFRAHELLSSYQESFILRLYREQKADGFVKAFSDQPTAIASGGLGQLQRLFDKLYIKKIRLLPRFDTVVKLTYDVAPPKLSEFEVELPMALRRVRLSLMDIIRICVRELKSTVHSLEIVIEDDAMSPSAALYPTKLELDLRCKTLLLTERQLRIMNDLRLLRTLLRKVEDLDPYSAFKFLQGLRNDKDLVDNNSGWLFTPTAAKVFSGLEGLCATKTSEKSPAMIATPPKWNALRTVLNELAEKRLEDGNKILLITPSDECSRQLVDVIKFGGSRFQWMLTKAMMTEKSNASQTPGKEPGERSWWNPNCVVLYDTQIDLKNEHKTLVTKLQNQQKKASKNSKRGRVAEASETPEIKKYRQASLVNFGVIRHERRQKLTTKPLSSDACPETPTTSKSLVDSSAMVVLLNHGDKYNLINALENLEPSFIILYHLDVASLRIIETYNAAHSEKKLHVYTIMYKESAEEERYLLGIQREHNAFEMLIREQGVLMVPNAYDVSREGSSKLRQLSLAKDSRVAVSPSDLTNRVIIDMREFNSELPTFLYKQGVELDAVTLEVGDYILAPTVAVERKALDDLAQSLGNGRIFKQIEQMLRHYPRTILLIESNDKFKHRKVNGGPFQGELSRRSRETRSLLAMLIRAHPRMSILWSVNPRYSAELFEEVKMNEPNPDIDAAAMIRSTDLGTNNTPFRVKLNPVVKRALTQLRGMGSGDVESLMSSEDFQTPLDIFTAETDALSESLRNTNMAQKLKDFFTMDFRYF